MHLRVSKPPSMTQSPANFRRGHVWGDDCRWYGLHSVITRSFPEKPSWHGPWTEIRNPRRECRDHMFVRKVATSTSCNSSSLLAKNPKIAHRRCGRNRHTSSEHSTTSPTATRIFTDIQSSRQQQQRLSDTVEYAQEIAHVSISICRFYTQIVIQNQFQKQPIAQSQTISLAKGKNRTYKIQTPCTHAQKKNTRRRNVHDGDDDYGQPPSLKPQRLLDSQAHCRKTNG